MLLKFNTLWWNQATYHRISTWSMELSQGLILNHSQILRLSIMSCKSWGVTVWPGKLWTLKVSRECLLCYNQSQQRSGHVNWLRNHKLINILACSLVFSRLIGFFFCKTIGTLRSNDATAMRTLLRKWSCVFSVLLKYGYGP